MDNFPEIVFLKLTSRCNQNCRYCYDSKKHPDLPFEELKKIFFLLSNKGVKALVLTGGEPLIRNDIPQIFQEIKNNNLKIYLDTNGDFFFKYRNTINKFVDILGLPIDSSLPPESYRDEENFKNIIKILKYYSEFDGNKPLIRIGTVATKENISFLDKIAELLKKYKIDSWKIYQFIPIGPNGFANKESLLVSNEEFSLKTEEMVKKHSSSLNIIPSPRQKRRSAYFFISSDGTVFMPEDDDIYHGDRDIGNIFDKDIIQKWHEVVNLKNYKENIQETFK